MSRVAKSPIKVPAGVDIKQNGQELAVKGSKGELKLAINPLVSIEVEAGEARVVPASDDQKALVRASNASWS